MKLDKTFGVIRHLRPEGESRGGVVFVIDIDHAASLLSIGWAICLDTENFNREYGRVHALERLQSKRGIQVRYDPQVALVENITSAVKAGSYELLSEWPEAAANLRTLLRTVTKLR